ncbi:Prolamin-like domain-containing protein [Artemisia annua]|uniref:Prolamin-like domain-containing protein n=1 Tax=Artemisia annua TaxID=35608 RepID=A0A2U1LFR2_ARTAN|nr:Prolamin-like domain-containing protein [Artemisia annua]
MLTLARQGSSSSAPDLSLDSYKRASAINCRSAFLTMGDCYTETSRAFHSGQVRIFLGRKCCQAAQELNSWCWPIMFGYNPFYPGVLDYYCSRFENGPPITLAGTARTPEPLEADLNKASEDVSNDHILASSPADGV